jgi:predicted porin
MKKSLLAIAAMTAFAGAAQAQSSVTVYGVIDTGIANITNVANTATVTASGTKATATGMQNGGLGTPRFGLKGSEDLGGGSKALFVLESEFLSADGSQASSQDALFNRASWVGLDNAKLGTIKLGRMNTAGYDALARMETFGGGNIGGAIAIGGYGYARIKDAVSLESPRMFGIQAIAQSGTATDTVTLASGTQTTANTNPSVVAGDYNQNRLNQFALNYLAGPLEVWATIGKLYSAANATANANAIPKTVTSQIFGNYSITPAIKLNASWVSVNTYVATLQTSAQNTAQTSFGVNYQATPVIGLDGIYTSLKTLTSATSNTPKVYGARVRYDLSKRTTVYGIVAASSQDNGSAIGLTNTGKFSSGTTAGNVLVGGTPAVAGVNQTGVMIGVRHTF